jgi:hypothetical protein
MNTEQVNATEETVTAVAEPTKSRIPPTEPMWPAHGQMRPRNYSKATSKPVEGYIRVRKSNSAKDRGFLIKPETAARYGLGA